MSSFIKDNEVLEKYNEIQKISAIASKKDLIEPVYNEKYLKTKIKS